MPTNTFDEVPVDEDTRILRQRLLQVDGREALFQQWAWEGITGCSLILLAEDVAELDDEALSALPARYINLPEGEGKNTIKRVGRYVFISFGFEY